MTLLTLLRRKELAAAAAATYTSNVLALNPIAYWPLNETTGTAAVNYGSIGTAGNGTYSGPSLANIWSPIPSQTAPLFDGSNDVIDVYTTALRDAFDDAEGTVGIWCKVSEAGVWVDGHDRRHPLTLYTSGSNKIYLYKSPNSNDMQLLYQAGGTSESKGDTSLAGTTDWFHLAMTWSKSNERVVFYINGERISTSTTLGTWAGVLSSGFCNIGAYYSNGQYGWDGWLSQAVILDYEATSAQITTLATPPDMYALRVYDLNPIAYWPMTEAEGTTAYNYGTIGTAGNGTYDGVTLASGDGPIDGESAPLFDGVDDYLDVYSTALNTAVVGAEGTASIWCRVSGAGVWTDGAHRAPLSIQTDDSNTFYFRKTTVENEVLLYYAAGGTTEFVKDTSLAATTDWFHLSITWSASEDRVRHYINGVQIGADATALGVWVGALNSAKTLIGSYNTAGTWAWDGYLAHAVVLDYEATPAQVATLANLPEYTSRVLELGPIAYFPMNETTGTTAKNLGTIASGDGTYSGATLASVASPITGDNAPLFDGTTDYLDIYSAALNTAFDGAEGTMGVWCKMSAAGIWTDGVSRYIMQLKADASNRAFLSKITSDNSLRPYYEAGGTVENASTTQLAGETSWFHLVMSWSASNDRVRYYVNGILYQTDTTLGTWVGALSISESVIGASNTASASVWSGYLSHATVLDYEATPAQVAVLANMPEYTERVLGLNPIAYFPMNETSGTTAVNLGSITSGDGTYSGATLASGDGPISGESAPLFDGTDDYLDIYTAALAAAFDGAEGTVSIWCKVSGAGVWTDGTQRRAITLRESGSNRAILFRDSVDNGIRFIYTAGGTGEDRTDTSLTATTAWFHLTMTWSASGDRMRTYINGVQIGADLTALGTWVGALSSTATIIGAQTAVPAFPWSGYLAHAAILDYEATPAEVAILANKPVPTPTYREVVEALAPIAYFPMNEVSGTTAVNLGSISSGDGTYSGATLNSIASPIAGDNAPLFDGVNDYTDIYSAALAAAWDGDLFTVSLWFRAIALDGTLEWMLMLRADGDNRIMIYASTTSLQVVGHASSGGVTVTRSMSSLSNGQWYHLAMTRSQAGDRFIVYLDGVKQGATLTGLSPWVGALASNVTLLGADNTAPTLPFNGYLSHAAIFDSELTAAQVLTLATPPTYQERVSLLAPIAYFPMNETTGTTATNVGSISSGDGTYSGVTLNSIASPITGDNAPSFDGVNDYTDIYSAALAAAWDGNEGTLSLWFKVAAAGVWTDSTIRYLAQIQVDSSNRLFLRKTDVDNTILIYKTNAGTTDSESTTAFGGDVGWQHIAITWSDTGDSQVYYRNGVAIATDTGIGTWAGSLDSTKVLLGADSTAGASSFSGYLSHAAIFDSELTAAQVAVLADLPTYTAKVLELAPIAYFPMNETTGTTATNYGSITSGDGTYSGATLNSIASPITGDNAPLFDGTNDYLNISTAALIAALDTAEGTMGAWCKMSAAGVWADGVSRYILRFSVDSQNTIIILKTTVANEVQFTYEAGNIKESFLDTSLAGTADWFHVALTWSVSNDRAIMYVNGTAVSTKTVLGTWVGTVSTLMIGAATTTPTFVTDGYLSHAAVFDSELTAAQILTLATAI